MLEITAIPGIVMYMTGKAEVSYVFCNLLTQAPFLHECVIQKEVPHVDSKEDEGSE